MENIQRKPLLLPVPPKAFQDTIKITRELSPSNTKILLKTYKNDRLIRLAAHVGNVCVEEAQQYFKGKIDSFDPVVMGELFRTLVNDQIAFNTIAQTTATPKDKVKLLVENEKLKKLKFCLDSGKTGGEILMQLQKLKNFNNSLNTDQFQTTLRFASLLKSFQDETISHIKAISKSVIEQNAQPGDAIMVSGSWKSDIGVHDTYILFIVGKDRELHAGVIDTGAGVEDASTQVHDGTDRKLIPIMMMMNAHKLCQSEANLRQMLSEVLKNAIGIRKKSNPTTVLTDFLQKFKLSPENIMPGQEYSFGTTFTKNGGWILLVFYKRKYI